MDNVKKKILDLFDFALNNPDNKKQIIDIFIINELLAKKIEKSTQLFVEKYHFSIDNYSILHTLNKHGNEITEQERGQIAVIKNDFTLIQDIIENSNSIELSEKKFQSKNVIIFLCLKKVSSSSSIKTLRETIF